MATRLGELLVGFGLLTAEQLEQALRAQVMWGGRIGTNLVELGFVDLDTLARVLGGQHKMPAVLGKQFEKTDRELQKLLSPDVAEKFSCVPLTRVGPDRNIVLASLGPLTPKAIAIVADELVVDPARIVPSVAAELRIRYHLERVYEIPRGMRFLRSRGKTIPPFPTLELPSFDDVSEVNIVVPALDLAPAPGSDLDLDPASSAPALELATAPVDHAYAIGHAIDHAVDLDPAIPLAIDPPELSLDPPELSLDPPELELDPMPIEPAHPPFELVTSSEPAHHVEDRRTKSDRVADDQPFDPPSQQPEFEQLAELPEIGLEDVSPIDLEAVPEPLAHPVAPTVSAPKVPTRALTSIPYVEDLDDLSGELVDDGEPAPEPDAAGRDRRRYVPTLADVPIPIVDEDSKAQTPLGRVSLRRVQITTPPFETPAPLTCATLGEATRAIRRANGRDRVAELVMETLERFAPTCESALFLVLRGEAAIGWKGFARSGAQIPQVAVPLDEAGIVPTVVRHNATSRCNAGALGELDDRLFKALGPREGDLVVVPITIGGQVMCMLATATPTDAPVTVIESIAAAAGAAFARLMRDASR